ncbi:histidinol-phosphatase [Desulfoluna sp.]|uniref:histidinol-phosphatase n=1 Tax=Desulfoluna sp. TaxID=2045199 RepID=UPI00262D7CF5|nr:histidinol-phosphatase [Desulfoluna sp.]
MIDYHIHTLLCNHAEGDIRSYVEAAVRAGLSEICFLEHFSLDTNSTAHAMHPNEVPLYVYAVQEMKRAYQDRITIRTGLEIDVSPEAIPALEHIIQTFDFDLIGGSIHFVDGVNIASRRHAAALSTPEFQSLCRRYVERVREMVETPFFDVVCHLDVIKKNGRPLPEDVQAGLLEIIDRMAEKNLALEVNTGGLTHPANACYPAKTLLAHAISLGIPLTTGSDAHTAQRVGAGLATAIETLQELGATHLAQFEKRRRTLVPIAPTP